MPDRWLPARTPRRVPLPLLAGKVAAGFPSPADDYIEKTLDLNELLVRNGDYIWRQNKQVEQGKFRTLRMPGEA